ncbi:DUF2827 family protein [Burkholderia ambifaria]|uniref:DUF2827 family protein n=1 Tax=Burkholderia ambifaria TaxID=152480 RepID=UPI002B4B9B39|nr:DUF2827 family protein [Burkholderia ambifaria]
MGQNILFFARLLRGLPFVTDVVLLDCGDQKRLPPDADGLLPGLRLIPPREATDLIDVAVEMGGGLDIEWIDYIRKLGKRVVFLCCGQPYVGLIEPSLFNRGGYFSRAQRCDEIWILSKDRALKPMLEALHRCPAFEVPFLWHPMLVERRIRDVEQAGYRFGYAPKQDDRSVRAMKVAIFEPNISVVKSCVVPMLICDAAYRRCPAGIERLHLLNSAHMVGHPTFDFIIRSLALQSAAKVELQHRHDFVGYMSQFADVVITHQWCNDQNIAYLDALYGGYPLVHNSPWLEGVGYAYRDFDINAGSEQLIRVATSHDAGHAAYVEAARLFLAGLGPDKPANREAYAKRLLHLASKR